MYLLTLLLLLALTFAAAVTDCRCRRIPNELIIAGIFLKITGSFAGIVFFGETVLQAAAGLPSAFALTVPLFFLSRLYKSFSGRPAFGGGDLKLLFVVFLFFDFPNALRILLGALVFGAAAGILLRSVRKKTTLPFAPAVFDSLLVAFFLACHFC